LGFGSQRGRIELSASGVSFRHWMRSEPAGNSGFADADAVPRKELRNCADTFPFAAQFPNNLGVIVEL